MKPNEYFIKIYIYIKYLQNTRVLLNPPTTDPPTTDQPTTEHLPTDQPTHQPKIHQPTDKIPFQRLDEKNYFAEYKHNWENVKLYFGPCL